MVNRIEGVSIAQFFDLAEISGDSQALLVEGDTGIGKTQIVARFAEMKGLPLCTIQVNEGTDMVDVNGLPDFEDGHTVFRPPSWYKAGEKCVLFMDEVNRNATIMKGLMRLATDHRIGDIVLPPGSYVIGAINPEYGQVYQVVEMDPAHRARFMLVQLRPTVDEWLKYGRDNGFHPAVLSYVEKHPDDLDTFHNEENVTKAKGQFYHNVLPCRRQFEELSKKLFNAENFRGTGKSRFDLKEYPDAEDMLYATVAGLVGVCVAGRFVPHYYSRSDLEASDLLFGTDADWATDGEMVKSLKKMARKDIPGLTQLGYDLMDLLARNEKDMWNDFHSEPGNKAVPYGMNVYKFLYLCPAEVVNSIYYTKIRPALNEAERMKKAGDDRNAPKWEKLMCIAVPKIKELLDKYVK